MPISNVRRPIWRIVFLCLVVLGVASCSTKAERYARHVARGEELVKEGKDVKAVLEFKTALQSNPAGTEANYQLGMIAERLNDWAAARALFAKVTDQDPKHVGALLEEGRIYLMADDPASALTAANTAVSLAPQNAQAHALKGAAQLRQGQLAAAEQEANASLKIVPNNASAIAVLAGIRARQNQPGQALSILDEGIKANPTDSGLKLAKLTILDQQGNSAEAETTEKALVASEPKVLAYRLDLVRRLMTDHEIDAAEAVLREGVKAVPADVNAELALVSFLKQNRSEAAAEAELASRVAAKPKDNNLKLLLAQLYFEGNKKDQARAILQTLADEDSSAKDTIAARVALARYALAEGKTEEAKTQIAKALAKDSGNSDALMLRANLDVAADNLPAAITDLRSALKNAPNLKPALVALARTYGLAGETELGADFFQRALDADPADLELRVEFAQQRLTSGHPGEADDQLRLVLASEPDFGPALAMRANLLASQQKWAAAEDAAQQLISLPAYAALGHQLLGKIFVATKQYANGIPELKQALALSPKSFESERMLAIAYANSGDRTAATQYVQSLIDASPNEASPYQLMGEVKAQFGSVPEAKAAYERSIALDPGSANARLALGNLLAANGDYPSAARIFADGVKANPQNVDLLFASAYAEERLDHFDSARAGYQAVLKRQPRNVAAANNLAGLIADAWPGDKALLEEARRLTEPNRNSTNPALLDTLGWVQFRLGNVDDALALLQSAAASAPKEPAICYHLGVALLKSGNTAKARTELELAVATNTPYRGIDDARKALASD